MNTHTPKGRPISLEVSKKTSPATSRTARKLKTQGSNSESTKTVKDTSPKLMERRSPTTPAIQKKRPVRVSELDSHLVQLQNELKKMKDQLGSSESLKQKAQEEAEEAKRHLASVTKKLDETRKQLEDLSDSEDSRVQELRKISQDRDRAWQSELEAVQKQNSMDSAALASAMNEIQRLRIQVDRVAESGTAQARLADSSHVEIQNLRMELTETLSLVEELKTKITEGKESEKQALEEISKAQMQLEVAKITEKTLQSEILEATEAYKSVAFELKQSQNRVTKLEEIVAKLQQVHDNTDPALVDDSNNPKQESAEHRESDQLKAELTNLKQEAEQLRTELEAAERRYQEEYIQGTLQIRSAYEVIERTKVDTCEREAEWEAKLEVAVVDADKWKNEVMEKEVRLQTISEENKGLHQMVEQSESTERGLAIELEKCKSFVSELNARLSDKEIELHGIAEENDSLKSELQKREVESCESKNESSAVEQLEAAEAKNCEMEAELRRLKVQGEQWRKAAEAAAALLSTGNNGKYVALDYHTLAGKLGSPYSEDMDDDSPNKKNGNMFKKIGTLLKKK